MVSRLRIPFLILGLIYTIEFVPGCSSPTGGSADNNSFADSDGNANDNSIDNANSNDDGGSDEVSDMVADENANENVAGNANDNATGDPPDNTNDNSVDDSIVNDDLIPSACCLSNGDCVVTTREECDGAFVGGGELCNTTSCTTSPFTDEAVERDLVYVALFPRGAPDVVPGSGIGFIDLDNDEDSDIVVIGHIGDGLVGVFENDGRGRFKDRSADSGITPNTLYRGITAGDYDSDGDWDLYISTWTAANVLLRNEGDFRFTDVTETAGVGHSGLGTGCAWGDYDGDGWLDLYASDYGIDMPNRLYHNKGDGTFEEVSEPLGVTSGRRTMQAQFLDYDQDNDMDLYVANDLMGFECPECCNELYRNDGGVFVHVSDDTGANVCLNSMCIAVGDVDNNMQLDMFFTDDALSPGNVLILNQGDGTFVDGSSAAAINPMGSLGWGAIFFDYDNDGFQELFVTYNISANEFYENDGTFPLTNVAAQLDLADEGQSYCVSVADVDNDGDLDMALWNRQENIRLYINKEGQKRRWVKFNVVGERLNAKAIGATVTLHAGGLGQVRHLTASNNFKGQDESTLHFGLNTARVVDDVLVAWPSGTSRMLTNYPGNKTWKLYPPSKLGDANGDGVIRDEDRAALETCKGVVRPGCEMMDIDGDGDVDDTDQAAQ